MMEALELLGVHVATLGNHDLDFGVDRARHLLTGNSLFEFEGNPPQRAVSEWVCSNMTGLDGEPLAGTNKWLIKEWNGVKVGIIAVSQNWLADAGLSPTNPSPDKHGKWTEEASTARFWAEYVRKQGAEIVLCLVHDNLAQLQDLSDNVPEVDFFLGGHEHSYMSTSRWLIAGFDFDDFCLLTFELPADGSRPAPPTMQRVSIAADIPTADELKTMDLTGNAERIRHLVRHYSLLVESVLTKPLGCSLSAELDTRRFKMRSQETIAGNFFADAILADLRDKGAECCFIIAGMISAGPGRKPAGPLTMGDIVQWFPWEGSTALIEITGAVLLQCLEHGCHHLPLRYGTFPQVSGIQFNIMIDEDSKPGEYGSPYNRISDVFVAGEPLNLSRLYRVATGDYVADGGDDFTMLSSAKRLLNVDAAPLLHDTVIKYLLSFGDVVNVPEVSGRIRHLRTFWIKIPEAEIGATPMDPVSKEETLVKKFD